MKLLSNEKELLTSNGNKIILTNYRIQLKDSIWGQSFAIIIFLEDISSIEVKYKSNLLFIALAILSLLFTVYSNNNIGFLISCIFFAIWWFTRKHIIAIAPNGGSVLNFQVEGMNDSVIYDFIDNVSSAKLNRIGELAQSNNIR